MKSKILTLSLLALAVSATTFAVPEQVPCVTVEYIVSGTDAYAKAISSIAQLTFAADGTVSLVFNNEDVRNLGTASTIKQISFGNNVETQEAPTVIASTKAVTVQAFPNPASDVLRFTGKADNAVARLFTLDGKFIKQTTDNELNVSDLSKGTYLLMIDAQAIKIIKN